MMKTPNEIMPFRLSEQLDGELAVLALLDRVLIDSMGGVFVETGDNFTGMTHVLDVGSGSGTWAVRLARDNPALEVTGLTCKLAYVNYGEGQAEAQGIENVEFARINWTPTEMPFEDEYFDVVNARFLFGLLRPEEWPTFFQECWRITKPGGYLRVTECEWAMSTSTACDTLSGLFLKALKSVGQSLSPHESLGTIARLEYFLSQTGWSQITRRASVDNYLNGQYLPADPQLRVEILSRMILPLILGQEVATQADVALLLKQAALDIGREDFCSIVVFLTFCARKVM